MTNINIISFFIGKILKKFPFFRETFAAPAKKFQAVDGFANISLATNRRKHISLLSL